MTQKSSILADTVSEDDETASDTSESDSDSQVCVEPSLCVRNIEFGIKFVCEEPSCVCMLFVMPVPSLCDCS